MLEKLNDESAHNDISNNAASNFNTNNFVVHSIDFQIIVEIWNWKNNSVYVAYPMNTMYFIVFLIVYIQFILIESVYP